MKHTTFILLLFFASIAKGQNPFAERVYYSTNTLQEARRIIRTPDNEFLVVGYVAATSSSLNRDGLVFKINTAGDTIRWSKKYGDSSNWEEFYDMTQVGNYYYCVGYTRTWVNGRYPPTGTNLTADVFLVKIKFDGTVVWAKNMGKPTNGTSATDGNDIGLRLIASGEGGVIIVVRVNSGASTKQNNALLWVDSNGKSRWAYQYDWPNAANANELTYGIWKDNAKSYITGGWFQKFASPDTSGGFLFKINQNGSVIWDRFTRYSTGSFMSQYFGYYNHKNGKIYSTDFYSQTNGSSVRQSQVITNLAASGNVPTGGGVTQAKRFYFGASDNYRGYVFPLGDGYEQFILASYDLTAPASGSSKRANLLMVDEDLTLQWSKKVGVNTNGYLSQVHDLVACDGENQSIFAVGTVVNTSSKKEILITRFTGAASTNDWTTLLL